MKKGVVRFLACSCVVFGSITPVFAEDLNQIFKRVNDYIAQENYPKALEELSWAKKEVDKLHSQKLSTLLPDSVEGYTAAPAKIQSAMGFTNIERVYKNGSKQIKISITGGEMGGALGGLAGLARMGMMMGDQGGGESDTFRIDGRTATLSNTGGSPELTILLESGPVLKLEGSNGADAAALKSVGEQMKISAIDQYLRGSK